MSQKPILQSNIKQSQQLIMSYAMNQALLALQLPTIQLAQWVEKEVEQNPILELLTMSKEKNIDSIYSKNSIPNPISRHEHIKKEIAYHFQTEKEKEIASYIAGSLDENGFFTLPHSEICLSFSISSFQNVLYQFQHSIDPIGMGAPNVQECLLIQLRAKQQEDLLIYQIVKQNFTDLLHNRMHLITKKFSIPLHELQTLIRVYLKPLHPFPGRKFIQDHPLYVIPDLFLEKEEEKWSIKTNQNNIPNFHIHPLYATSPINSNFNKEEREYIRRHLASGKWLRRILHRRHKILCDIGIYLIKNQSSFLEGKSCSPTPMTMHQAAKDLEVNDSTITRAIANKYLSCPIGIVKIRNFFTQSIQTKTGTISNQKAKNILAKLIAEEDKKSPFSDQKLSQKLKDKGIFCARRTIAKYRQQMHIDSAAKRRRY